ncbi:hypothetical protein ABD76_10705 [Paenibacillus dendritiformis]|nr:hypothetical protein [Paenibacillus dendritiformis]
MGELSQNGNTLARIYVQNEQKGLSSLAKELGEALKKDLSHLGSNAREQLEKLRNTLNPPPRYQFAGASHMGNEASDLFKNMSKELKESLQGLQSKLNVMKSSSGGSGGNHPLLRGRDNRYAESRFGKIRITRSRRRTSTFKRSWRVCKIVCVNSKTY